MKITLERELDEAAWGALVAADPDASFFHDPVFMRALAALYPHFHPLHLLARDDRGRLLGGIPVVRVMRTGLAQILSLPFGSYGTPLALDGASHSPVAVRAALVGAWLQEARRAGVVRAHFVPLHLKGSDPAALRLPHDWRIPERTHVVPLTEGFEAIWFKRYDKENRTASRKAVRLGVVVAPEAGPIGAEILDALYRPWSRQWTGHTPYRYGLFHRLEEMAGDRARVWVARQGDRPVFAVMAFYHKDTVTPWVSGSSDDARALCAGNLAHKVLIEDACSRGYALYNFGSSGGIAGLEAFKVAFGGVPVDYSSWLRQAGWFRGLRLVSRRLRGLKGE